MITLNIDPVAFTVGSLAVRWYGIMIALAILVLVLWLVRAIRKGADISYDTLFTAALVAIPSAVIFSRLLHVIDKWSFYSQNPGQILGFSGLTIYGAILGATLAVWVYSRFASFRFAYLADIAAPGIVLAQAVGRVGCILNGCCYGSPTDLFCGVIWEHPGSAAPIGVAVHPTQFYEIILLLLMFGGLLWLRGRLKLDGALFMAYLGLYSLWRFGIGFLREGDPFLFGLQEAQVIGLIVVVVVVPLLIYRIRKDRDELSE
ncbi:MAG: prolipoprotein diacylglyceryl transferase [Dehalococcoidales bacterium]